MFGSVLRRVLVLVDVSKAVFLGHRLVRKDLYQLHLLKYDDLIGVCFSLLSLYWPRQPWLRNIGENPAAIEVALQNDGYGCQVEVFLNLVAKTYVETVLRI